MVVKFKASINTHTHIYITIITDFSMTYESVITGYYYYYYS